MWVGYYDTATSRSLVKFDLSSISASSIFDSAVLSLYLKNDWATSDVTWRVYRLKRNWIETQTTWKNYASGASWQTAGATGANDIDTTELGSVLVSNSSSVGTEIQISLTASEVQKMFDGTYSNYGFLIKGDPDTNRRRWYLYTRENAATDRRPKLTVVSHVYDPVPYGTYDQYTKALLHFDGSEGSYTFRDELQNTWTPYRYPSTSGSGAYITTSEKKFGTGGGYFSGSTLGDWIQTSTDFGFRGNNFTNECFVYFTAPANNAGIFGEHTSGDVTNSNYQGLRIAGSIVSGSSFVGARLAYTIRESGSYLINYGGTSGMPLYLNTWHHIAAVRYGNIWSMYLDGIHNLRFTYSGSLQVPTNQFFKFGQVGGSGWMNGIMDEGRISVGIARYTDDFTPPQYPFAPITSPLGQPVMYSGYPWV
jgi:hypothetical protein